MMRSLRTLGICALALVGSLSTGCMPKMTIAEMKAEMTPERPPELDRLNVFLGSWKGTASGRMDMLDPPEFGGTDEMTMSWGCDGWCLVGDSTGESELGKRTEHVVWTYDRHAGKYRTFYASSMGDASSGTATCDESGKHWKMSASSKTPYGTMTFKGTMDIIDDTMEWTFAGYVGLGTKMMEMKGTSKRKK